MPRLREFNVNEKVNEILGTALEYARLGRMGAYNLVFLPQEDYDRLQESVVVDGHKMLSGAIYLMPRADIERYHYALIGGLNDQLYDTIMNNGALMDTRLHRVSLSQNTPTTPSSIMPQHLDLGATYISTGNNDLLNTLNIPQTIHIPTEEQLMRCDVIDPDNIHPEAGVHPHDDLLDIMRHASHNDIDVLGAYEYEARLHRLRETLELFRTDEPEILLNLNEIGVTASNTTRANLIIRQSMDAVPGRLFICSPDIIALLSTSPEYIPVANMHGSQLTDRRIIMPPCGKIEDKVIFRDLFATVSYVLAIDCVEMTDELFHSEFVLEDALEGYHRGGNYRYIQVQNLTYILLGTNI